MDTPASNQVAITFETSQNSEQQAKLLHLTRFRVAFELYGSYVVVRTSESLSNFRVSLRGTVVYSGRAVVQSVISTSTGALCEGVLDELGWRDIDFAPAIGGEFRLSREFDSFIEGYQREFRVLPDFKLVVADMQMVLWDLQRWLEQVELAMRSQPSGERSHFERDALDELRTPVAKWLRGLFERFEEVVLQIDSELAGVHARYVKRQLHPLVLCAPFMYRTFQKPLGYAGDYEMVNMMTRDPYEGGSLFAKLLNTYFLNTPPVIAHRNRLDLLTRILLEETCRWVRVGRSARVFNLGCGPAKEVQDFIDQHIVSDHAEFTLLDFDEETLQYTGQLLGQIRGRWQRRTLVNTVRKSVTQLFKEAAKPTSVLRTRQYEVVYCAGLFDYLTDSVCQKLVSILYEMVVPGGLLVVTNVDESNPCRGWMEYSVDWHLIYRNASSMKALVPASAPAEAVRIRAEVSSVNILLEIRKPEDA